MTTQQASIARGTGASSRGGSGPPSAVDQRREDLIEATLAVLAERGLAGATTRAITERAGLALGAFHYAFASKEELLAAVMERMADTLDGLLIDPLGGTGPVEPAGAANEPAATLTAVLRRLWQVLDDAPSEQLAQFELMLHARREPGLVHLANRRQERLAAGIARAVRETPGPLDETAIQELTRAVVDHLDGLLLHRLLDEGPDESARRLEQYLASMDAVVAAHVPVTHRANGR